MFRSEDVLRFPGHRVKAEGRVPANFTAEVTSDLKLWPLIVVELDAENEKRFWP